LLLGMQQESLLHALSHIKQAKEQQELSSPQTSVACVECALLVAGSAAIPSSSLEFSPSPGTYLAIPPAHVAPALAHPHFHRSRAPPFLS
jgi:hypothetical protein